MYNKKGFTLVELLAVIAILAILVIIALPNVMGMFNRAKKSSFDTEIKEMVKIAKQSWIRDSLTKSTSQTYVKCKNDKCEKEIDMNVGKNFEYYIEMNGIGDIIKMYATDGTYQYKYCGNKLDIKEEITTEIIANIPESEKIVITCDDVMMNSKSCIKDDNEDTIIFLEEKLKNDVKTNNYYLKYDDYNNIRYIGVSSDNNMNNYVKFEDSNKEWRILGIIDNKVKLIEQVDYGNITYKLERYWGSLQKYVSSDMDDWKTAKINEELNTTYYASLSPITRRSIIESVWAHNTDTSGDVKNIYEKEREAINSNDLNHKWTGKIASIYLSDYYYSRKPDTVYYNNWIRYGSYYTTTNSAVLASAIVPMNAKGWIGSQAPSKFTVYPTIYINSNVYVKSGNGTKQKPYILGYKSNCPCE